MKKNVLLIPVCILALAFLMPATAHCRGFLKKLKQKVENAVVGTDESEDNMDRDSEEGETENATKSPSYQRPVQQTHPATATGERKAETTGKSKTGASEVEQVRFCATAYNVSFKGSYEDIQSKKQEGFLSYRLHGDLSYRILCLSGHSGILL